MPGFSIGGTGGDTSSGPSNVLETRRKHRWRFNAVSDVSGGPPLEVMLVLKTASRPSMNFEEAEMDHNQETAYFAGKTKWETITLTYYDSEQDPDSSEAMWNWVNAVSLIPQANVVTPDEYKGRGELFMLDGIGAPSEQWALYGVWPQSTNWQDLDYTSSDIQTVEVTMRYDRAERFN